MTDREENIETGTVELERECEEREERECNESNDTLEDNNKDDGDFVVEWH